MVDLIRLFLLTLEKGNNKRSKKQGLISLILLILQILIVGSIPAAHSDSLRFVLRL